MPAYLVVELQYEGLSWAEAYRSHVPAMVAACGGRYLTQPRPPVRVEGTGDLPDSLTILEFPDAETIQTFLASPAYAPYKRARQAETRGRLYILEGI